MKAALFGTPVENATVPAITAGGDFPSSSPISVPATEITNEPAPVPVGLEEWSVHPYVDPVFVKVGRVYLDAGDLILRSDRDTRGFVIPEEDLDEALTGGIGEVLLLDETTTIGFARLSQSGLAMNIVIDNQLHTVPMRSLTPVLTGHHRKAPLFLPAEDVVPDPQ